MKILITADWHFGYPGRLRDLAWAWGKMLELCNNEDINKVLLLGDLIHHREYLSHDVSNTVAALLDKANQNNIEIITFLGNHDMFLRHSWRINALKPFSKSLTFIEGIGQFNIGSQSFWTIPFVESERTYNKILHAVDDQANADDILLTHIGTSGAIMNHCFLIKNWNVVSFEDTKFNRIYTGHFHCYQQVGSKTWYPGSPIPFRFDEGVVNHGFVIYDIDHNEHLFHELNVGGEKAPPDFISIESNNISEISEHCKGSHVKVQLSEGDDREEIKKTLEENGALNVVFTKPKDESITIDKKPSLKTDSIFESWLEHDDPEKLDKKLLLSLEQTIRSEARVELDD